MFFSDIDCKKYAFIIIYHPDPLMISCVPKAYIYSWTVLIRFYNRYAIGQYVDQVGDVISHLNISNVRVEDGGSYTCTAVNSLGSVSHSARLNIYGT